MIKFRMMKIPPRSLPAPTSRITRPRRYPNRDVTTSTTSTAVPAQPTRSGDDPVRHQREDDAADGVDDSPNAPILERLGYTRPPELERKDRTSRRLERSLSVRPDVSLHV